MSGIMITIPAVALRGITILPGAAAHFDISRERSIKALEEAMLGEQKIFLITQKEAEKESPQTEDLYRIGTLAKIKQAVKMQNGIVRILVEGGRRGELSALAGQTPYLLAEVIPIEEQEEGYSQEEREGMRRAVQETYLRYTAVNPKHGREFLHQIVEIKDISKFMDFLVSNLPVYYEEKQKYLEALTLEDRYMKLMGMLLREINILSIKNEFQSKVKERVDKNQKEYLLREQMKVIREELGEDDAQSDAEQFLQELKKLEAKAEVKDKIQREIQRFSHIPSNSSESTVARNYIETLLELPWEKASKDNSDLKNAARVLEEDHYGLKEAKERMLEFLAVRSLAGKGASPIICLVGPPGTGKTSFAKSVARALNKEYVRICLGGVRDEAEIRGHRRTYVGAMPGRIAEGLCSAGVKNPLMLLDEIDKISSDYKGDTSAALLEVLDSEQNNKFRDHYVEIPLDLSEVLFIATANSIQGMPRPLLDRMELIEVNSYTENEKVHIAKEHLLPKQIQKNGLKDGQLAISREAIALIARCYAREAGVRNLERKISKICRKTAREIYEGSQKKVSVTRKNLEYFLGKEKYALEKAGKTDEIGVVRGLAWTSAGGDILEIEVSVVPGKGDFKLTGQMGDVMKESAQAGISYIRSVSSAYKIPKTFFKEHDIHIHIPEGAVPKDGPSAGITMASAMLSAIIKRKIRSNVAMTGEITLRGRVLPIGGLKEKILAAKAAGIQTVCIPKKNEKDMEEIAEEIKQGLKFVYVETMKDVLKTAFV